MQIWVDGDACPKPIKNILFRASERNQINLIIVANHEFKIPSSLYIKTIIISKGFDVADNYIIKNVKSGDLVITADIPLADEVITHGCLALNPRGDLYTPDNIKQKLTMRNFNQSLRDSGMIYGGNTKLNPRDIQKFANHLDRIIQQKAKCN